METYRVHDNSHQLCLETQINECLAGTMFDPTSEEEATVKVITQPFEMTFQNRLGTIVTYRFIIGKCIKGRHHLILFQPEP